jgi:predicted patatin/cPLA2 family phospholipase
MEFSVALSPQPAEHAVPGVVDVVRRRLRRRDGDSFRLALVIEGGGMRGVISAGMAGAFEGAGLASVFDVVVGTSAGSLTAACFAAGRADALGSAYADRFTESRYASLLGPFRGRSIADPALIVDDTEEQLGFSAGARSSRLVLGVVSTSTSTATTTVFSEHPTAADLRSSLIASATLPLVGGRPVAYRGDRWLDGGIGEAVPLASARRLGATHALVLATRRRGDGPGWSISDRVVSAYLSSLNPELAPLYGSRGVRYGAIRKAAAQGFVLGMSVTALGPGDFDPVPSRLDRDPRILQTAHAAAQRVARDTIESWLD